MFGRFIGSATVEDLLMGFADLEIEDAAELTLSWCQANMHRGNVANYAPASLTPPRCTTREASLGSCDCPDAPYRPNRPGRCRHAVALRQALATCLRVVA